VSNGTTYYYEVTAVNAMGDGAISSERSATPATGPGAPTMNVPTAGNNSVALSWSAPTSNGGSALSGYKLYRATTSGSETLLPTLSTATNYSDHRLTTGTTHY